MSEDPLDAVEHAVRALKDRGAQKRVATDSLARLSATAGATGLKTTRPAQAAAPVKPPPPAPAPPTPEARPTPAPTVTFSQQAPLPKTAPAGASKAERLEAIRGPILACTKCPNLVNSRTQVVFGVGNPDAQIMFVGEAPGADEDLVGEPFVGKAGQLLTKIIETMGLRRGDVFIANVLKCRPNMPPGEPGNRKPTRDEMDTCKPYLLEQIRIIQPRVLVGLGATAIEGLLGRDKVFITKERGTWLEFEGIPLMPTFHPSYLLRNQALSEKRNVWEDMLSVMEKLGMPISAKQRGYFLQK